MGGKYNIRNPRDDAMRRITRRTPSARTAIGGKRCQALRGDALECGIFIGRDDQVFAVRQLRIMF